MVAIEKAPASSGPNLFAAWPKEEKVLDTEVKFLLDLLLKCSTRRSADFILRWNSLSRALRMTLSSAALIAIDFIHQSLVFLGAQRLRTGLLGRVSVGPALKHQECVLGDHITDFVRL